MRVMLSCVGNRDPFGSVDEKTGRLSEGPLVTALRIVEPDWLFLFPSAGEKGTVTTSMPGVLDWLQKIGFPRERVAVHPIAPENAADLTDVLQAMGEVVPSALREVPEDAELFVSISSGTPQMQQTWLVLSMLGRLRDASLWQVMDPTRLDPDVCPMWPVRLDILRLPAVLDEVEAAVAGCHFARAAQALARQSAVTPRGHQASALLALARILDAWDLHDRILYREALEQLGNAASIVGQIGLYGQLVSLVRDQARLLKDTGLGAAQQPPPGTLVSERLLFAYYMALRRSARGDLVGAIVFALAVLEKALEHCLGVKDSQDKLVQAIENAHDQGTSGWKSLEKIAGGKAGLHRIRMHRNDVVHDLRRPDATIVHASIAMAKGVLLHLAAIPDQQIGNDPFNPEAQIRAIREVLDLLRQEPV